MSEPVIPDPTAEDDSDQTPPPLPGKDPADDDAPMEPNPYMGGGTAPT
jgi:hypothetical protein